jgi:hypothetical protein
MCEFREDIYDNLSDEDVAAMVSDLNEARRRKKTCPIDSGHLVVLVVAPSMWEVDGEHDDEDSGVEITDNVTGYWCQVCERMVSLELNGK